MSTTIDLKTLLRSPRLPEYAVVIEETLRTERERREEFYDQIEESQKAEFIDGEVIVHSPARLKHSIVQGFLGQLLRTYVDRYDLGLVCQDKTLCVFPRNDYEPDIVFFDREKAAGFPDDLMKFPVPDFVVEILSDSTESRDRGIKFEDFETHGVREYWIVDADAEVVEQYVANGEQFQLQLKSGSGEIESVVIKGFRISIRAIFDRDVNLAAMDAQASRTD